MSTIEHNTNSLLQMLVEWRAFDKKWFWNCYELVDSAQRPKEEVHGQRALSTGVSRAAG